MNKKLFVRITNVQMYTNTSMYRSTKKKPKKTKPNSSLLIMRNKIHVPNFHSKIVWSSVTVIKIYFCVICVNDFYKWLSVWHFIMFMNWFITSFIPCIQIILFESGIYVLKKYNLYCLVCNYRDIMLFAY
jgi:hypothetical protein